MEYNEIHEYLQYNASVVKNDEVVKLLENAISCFDENTPVELVNSIYRALGMSNGWIEYKVKDFANETGLTRSAVRILSSYNSRSDLSAPWSPVMMIVASS